MLSNINTMFRIDPTRTLTLRRRYESAMYNRFRKLKGDIRTSIVTNDCFGLKELKVNEPLGIRQFVFERDPNKVVLFLAWLQKQVDNNILEIYYGSQLGSSIEEAWMNTYIRTSYEKGISRGQQELRGAGYQIPVSASISASMSLPFHIDRVGLLYTRNFTGLKGITDEMSKQIAGILAEGMATGEGPLELARRINNRVDKIGLTRAKTLARTEMIRAHHHAMIQEFKNWGVVGVRVLAEWVTAGDARVCDICKNKMSQDNGFGSGIFTLDQILPLIPLHPGCVTGDSVVMAPNATHMMSTKYSGPVIEVLLSNGTKLSVTPNHMFPTPNGFIMARFLSNSDYLFYSPIIEREVFGNPDYDRDVSRIDNIVKTFSESLGMSTITVPVSPKQLHGDGIFCKKDINIIDTTRFLKNGINTEFIKHFRSNNLTSGSIFDIFTSFSSFTSFFNSCFSTFRSDISIPRELLSFFNSCLTHSKDVSFLVFSGSNTIAFESSIYDVATNSEFFRKFINRETVVEFGDDFVIIDIESVIANIRSKWQTGFDESIFNAISLFTVDRLSEIEECFPGHVSFMKVIDVNSYHVTDLPVYDVSTMSTLYNVNGVLSSNCRCIAIPLDITDNKKLSDILKSQEN